MAESNTKSVPKSTPEGRWEMRSKYHTSMDPLIRSPLTDMFSVNLHNQHEIKCKNFEFHLAKCIEAYGFYRGIDECREVLHDFQECMTLEKRRSRFEIICGEFIRQVEAGERNYEKVPVLPLYLP